MSGGFFRGTSADQDTRFSNKQAKLLKSQKFAPELDHLVDMTKVKMDVIRPWIANRATELLGFEDEVLINFVYGLLDGKVVDGKKIQIQLTGFMEKNTGKFMKELWTLLLSAQNNVSGVPQQFLDAKEEEQRKKKEENDRISQEIQKRKESAGRELEREKLARMDDENGDPLLHRIGPDLVSRPRDSIGQLEEERKLDGKHSHKTRHSISPKGNTLSPPFHRTSPSVSRSCSRERHKSRSTSVCSQSPRHLNSPERRNHFPIRRSPTHVRHFRAPHQHTSCSPIRRRSPHSRRSKSPSQDRYPSPYYHRSHAHKRSSYVHRRSPSPLHRMSPPSVRHRFPPSSSPMRRKSPPSWSPMRRRSPSSPFPIRRRSPPSLSPTRRRFPSSLSSVRRRSPPSPSPVHHMAPPPPSPLQHRSSPSPPIRHKSPQSISPVRRRSPPSLSPMHRRSPPSLSPARRCRSPPSLSHERWSSPSLSPLRRRSPPLRRRSPSPVHRRSHSPPHCKPPIHPRKRSRSPLCHRSPVRHGSPNLVRNEYLLPIQRRSPLPLTSKYWKQSPTQSSVRRHSDSYNSLRQRNRSPSPHRSESPLNSRSSNKVHDNFVDRDKSGRPYDERPQSSFPAHHNLVKEHPNHAGSDKSHCHSKFQVGLRLNSQKHSRSRSPSTSPVLRRGGSLSCLESFETNREEGRTPLTRDMGDIQKEKAHHALQSQEDVEYGPGGTRRGRNQSENVKLFLADKSPQGRVNKALASSSDSRFGLNNLQGISEVTEHVETHYVRDCTKRPNKRKADNDQLRNFNTLDSNDAQNIEKRRNRDGYICNISENSENDLQMDHKKEAKRRRKAERRLRKEERRQMREERRRRKTERRVARHKVRTTDTFCPPSDFKNCSSEADDSYGDAFPGKNSHTCNAKEAESEEKRLEIELRKKALESLMAKKAIND